MSTTLVWRVAVGIVVISLLLWLIPEGGLLRPLFSGAETGQPAPLPAYRPEHALIVEINRVRRENGRLPPLKMEPLLEQVAQAHSQSMAEHDFFGHKGHDLSSPWERIEAAGYETWTVLAENIAAGYATPEEVVRAWMDSSRHRENLLNKDLREAGVGHFHEENDTYPGGTWGYQHYWTMDMGARWDAYPIVIEREAYSTTRTLVSLYIYGAEWASEMRLSNDGQNWSVWEPYQPTKAWALPPGNGLKQVYLELRNGDGTVLSAQDEIVLEEPPPAPPDPSLYTTPETVLFVLPAGEEKGLPANAYLQIWTGNGNPLAWHATWDRDWLRLASPAGITPSRVPLHLTDRTALLPAGLYTATVAIEGEGQRAEVRVRLWVAEEFFHTYLPLVVPSVTP